MNPADELKKMADDLEGDPMESLQAVLKERNIGFDELSQDRLYIMTGEAEGVTVVVLGRGRK